MFVLYFSNIFLYRHALISFPGQDRIDFFFFFPLIIADIQQTFLKTLSDEDFIALVGKCFPVCSCHQVVNGLFFYQLEYLSGNWWLT